MTDALRSGPVLIPAAALPYVQDKIDVIARRARRMRQAPPAVRVLERVLVKKHVGYDIAGRSVYREIPHVRVAVEGVRPSLDGWRVVANLVRVGDRNVIRSVEGEEIPDEYRDRANVCDHCGTRRVRNETWLFRHEVTGELKQVARNCCKDFVGATEIDLALIAMWRDAVGSLSDEYGGGGGPRYIEITEFLAATAALVRVRGWTPRSRATEDRPATASLVGSVVDAQRRPNDPHYGVLPVGPWPAITPDDWQAAADALAWIRSDRAGTGDYIENCRTACSADVVLPKLGAIVASVVGAAYPNWQKRQAEAAAERAEREARPASQHVGEVKQRITFEAVVERVRGWVSDWGLVTLIVMRDDAGNALEWRASGERKIAEGVRVKVRGTIKRHGTDRRTGERVTMLSRCVVTDLEPAAESAGGPR